MTNPTERGTFLTPEQKKVKQRMMEEMLDGFFKPMAENQALFQDAQVIIDLIASVLVMFNREIIVHTLKSLHIEHDGSKIMRKLFEAIRQEVTQKLKVGKYQ